MINFKNFAVVGSAAVIGYLALLGGGNSADDARLKATEAYLAKCATVIEDANKRAGATSSQSAKLDIMKKAFAQAELINSPENAEPGAVVRMKAVLKEGRECYESANGEWAIVRNIGLGLVTGVLDGLGGGGIATGTLLTGIGAEIAADDAEAREFNAAIEELNRYIADRK